MAQVENAQDAIANASVGLGDCQRAQIAVTVRGEELYRDMPMEPTRSSTTSALKVREFRSWEELASLESHWNALLAQSESDSIFLSWEYVSSWRDTHANHELFVMGCFDEDEALIGIAPLYISKLYISKWPVAGKLALSMLRLFGDDSGDCGNLDFVILKGMESEVVTAFVRHLEKSLDWDLLELSYLASDSPSLASLKAVLERRDWKQQERETPHLVLRLNSDWQTYLSRLSKNRRSSLLRYRRALESQQLTFRRCGTVKELGIFLEHLSVLHTMRWKAQRAQGAFEDEERKRFYFELGRKLLSRGELDFWCLELNSKIVAAEFGCIHNGTRVSMQSGFDPAYGKLGIGTVLDAHLIRSAIEAGIQRYDFLGGDHIYKRRWGAEQQPYTFLRCARPRSAGSLCIQLGRGQLTKTLGRRVLKLLKAQRAK